MRAVESWAILAFILAMGTQLLLTELDVFTNCREIMSTIVASYMATVAADPPVHMPVARNEREINAQQQHSAARYSELATASAVASDDTRAQPDEVRSATDDDVVKVDLAMRCGEKIPPESMWTTRGVEIHVRSRFQGVHNGEYMWAYTVHFRNAGRDTVQMLTRHWVFADAHGRTHEMKGPGARGVTPVLGPGDSWQYESGSTLTTERGSFWGSFQFETLRVASARAKPGDMFSARVARLALSPSDGSELVSCPVTDEDDDSAAALLSTSVRATRRVSKSRTPDSACFTPKRGLLSPSDRHARSIPMIAVIGANLRFMDAQNGVWRWMYDCQINNAREHEVSIVGHAWTVQTREQALAGKSTETAGAGVGGNYGSREMHLSAGEAFRIQGMLLASAPTANVRGHFVVRLRSKDGLNVEEYQAEVGALGAASDGTIKSVEDYSALLPT